MTGRRVSAREAVDWGFVNEATAEEVMVAARRWAMQLLTCGPLSLRATKETVLKGFEESLEVSQRAQWSYPTVRTMLNSHDAVEGPQAFVQKRPANWTGR